MDSASPHKTVDPGSHSSEEQDPMEHDGDAAHDFEVKEQDRWLPIANVARIMKTALPDNAKIAKEAKECMQECVSEFISFITSEASEKCQQEKRKTVNGEDILFAMTSLGFENYAEALKIYLSKYRETQSARGENQGHPLSPPGYTSDPTNPGASVPLGSPSAAGFVQGGDGQSVLGGAGGLDPSDHSGSAAAAAASYGYPGMVGGSHNGAGGNGY